MENDDFKTGMPRYTLLAEPLTCGFSFSIKIPDLEEVENKGRMIVGKSYPVTVDVAFDHEINRDILENFHLLFYGNNIDLERSEDSESALHFKKMSVIQENKKDMLKQQVHCAFSIIAQTSGESDLNFELYQDTGPICTQRIAVTTLTA